MIAPMHISVIHLFEQPTLRPAVARLIHDTFWTTVPGASAERMAQRLAQADRADAMPLCRVAVHDGQAIGVVNLVDNDEETRAHWSPWLAGMVVAEPWRGRGVGSQLVRTLLADAQRLRLPRVYLGTDGPGFYTRLGAVMQEQARADLWFMRFELPAPGPLAGPG